MALHVKNGSVWQSISALFAKTAGVWQRINAAYVRENGVWYQFLQAEVSRTATSTNTAPSATSYFTDAELDNPLLVKRLTIPPGVVLSAPASGSNWGLQVRHRGWRGDLIIDNYGTIEGRSGAPNAGTGGDALFATGQRGTDNQRAIFNNYGVVRSGGGGGGLAGVGGAGQYPYTYQEGPSFSNNVTEWFYQNINSEEGARTVARWAGTIVGATNGPFGSTGPSSYVYADYTYYRGGVAAANKWTIYRQQTRQQPTTGGVGGAGGRGRGSDNSTLTGAAGSAGGTNAGAGGTGGAGGDWGQPGSTGGTGGTGNVSAGVAGSPGGLAGYYLNGSADIIFNAVGGTVLGRLN